MTTRSLSWFPSTAARTRSRPLLEELDGYAVPQVSPAGNPSGSARSSSSTIRGLIGRTASSGALADRYAFVGPCGLRATSASMPRPWLACRAPAPTGSSPWTRMASTIPRRSERCWTPPSPPALPSSMRSRQTGLLTARSATSPVASRTSPRVSRRGRPPPLPQLPAGARRGGPRPGGLLRRGRLSRCGAHMGRQPNGHVPGADAGRARPSFGLLVAPPRLPLLADGAHVRTRPLRLVAVFGAFLGFAAFALMGGSCGRGH